MTFYKQPILLLFFCFSFLLPAAQQDRGLMVGAITGLLSYQGDLQPNSFTFAHAQPIAGIWLRQPLSNRVSVRAGASFGTLQAADAFNRDYLKARNLSFYSGLQEGFLSLDINLLDLSRSPVTPYAYAGVVVFHFNPYTYDAAGHKVYLQPLGTEGQGLAAYPDRKPYKRTQPALAFGGGLRFVLSDALHVSLEAGQRKTFTDYLDDVSKSFPDGAQLLQAHGAKAVELSYRGDELPGGSKRFPNKDDQRGTPTEMDWYYFTGLTVEVKINELTSAFSVSGRRGKRFYSSQRCPRFY